MAHNHPVLVENLKTMGFTGSNEMFLTNEPVAVLPFCHRPRQAEPL